MIDKQSKNTIKIVLAVILATFLGEGVLGWGLYWPFLLLLLDWGGVYWLAFVVGIFVSIFRGVPVGMPSVFLLVVVGALSILMGSRREMRLIILLLGIVINFIFDTVFHFGTSFWEVAAIIICGLVGVRWFERSETIRLNY